MRYQNTVKGTFIDRPNRFIAHVEVDGRTGATFSSDAIKKNVKLAVEYYEKNK